MSQTHTSKYLTINYYNKNITLSVPQKKYALSAVRAIEVIDPNNLFSLNIYYIELLFDFKISKSDFSN